jgi:uncharacterized protein YjbI with pentapeptide repeats
VPPVAAPPTAPRRPERLSTELDPEVDPEFPDVVDVELAGVSLSFPSGRTLTVMRSRLTACPVADDTPAPLDAADSELVELDLTGRRVASLDRVALTGCRLGGVDFGQARLRDVTFHDCVLDLASMRGCTLERVRITGGRVTGLDLSGAELIDVTVADVAVGEATLDGARMRRVDLRDADLSGLRDVAAIRGSTIGEVQAVVLASRLAKAAGVHVARTP